LGIQHGIDVDPEPKLKFSTRATAIDTITALLFKMCEDEAGQIK